MRENRAQLVIAAGSCVVVVQGFAWANSGLSCICVCVCKKEIAHSDGVQVENVLRPFRIIVHGPRLV